MPKSQKEMNSDLMIAIFKNLQTAKQSINNVLDKIQDSKLKRELKAQFKDYDELSESCEDLAKVYEIELSDNSFFQKAKMWINVNMATMMDKSNRKIASINIIGSTMGVLDLMGVLADSKRCKKELYNLGKTVLSLEERNIEKLKPYILIESEKQKDEVEKSSLDYYGNDDNPKKKQVKKNNNKKRKEALKYEENN
ncbi:MAG: hypothetical protein IKI95_07555 [Clostridia bacterium]|nr:hypothetical protein [Clostridia bacterium]